MANATRNAILRALLDGALCDLMVKTKANNVWINDDTTLATKLAEIVASLNDKVTTAAMEDAVDTAISNLIAGAPETYNTLKELADYISTHEGVVETLNAAMQGKADKTTVEAIQATVNGLGALSKKSIVSESDLDEALKAKVNAASEGNHSHSNKAVLDGITAADITSWNGKGKTYVQTGQPANITANDLWIQLV